MNDEPMNDMTTQAKETPLSIFQNELSRFKNGQKNKNFLYVILPLIIIALLVGGYFTYRYFKIKEETKLMNQNLSNLIKSNEDILLQNKKDGVIVPIEAVNSANSVIEESKLNGKYGLSREEVEKIKNSNQ